MNDFNWIVYDLKTKQSKKHTMDIPLVTDEFGLGEFTELKDGLIYTANRLDNGVLQRSCHRSGIRPYLV